MEPTQQPPQIQQPPRPMEYEDPSHLGPQVCVLGQEVPVRWLRPTCTVVLVQRLT